MAVNRLGRLTPPDCAVYQMKLLFLGLVVALCVVATLAAQRLLPTYRSDSFRRRLGFQLLARGVAVLMIFGFVGVMSALRW